MGEGGEGGGTQWSLRDAQGFNSLFFACRFARWGYEISILVLFGRCGHIFLNNNCGTHRPLQVFSYI